MRIIISKFSDWYLGWYRNSDHPEAVAIRNIISQNRQQSFMLLGEGTKFEHYGADGIHFYNVGQDTVSRYLFSFFFKFELASMLKPSVIVSLGSTNSIPLGISSVLTGARFIAVIPSEVSYAVKSMPKHLRRVTTFLLKIVFHKAHKILALGESIKKDLIYDYGITPEKIFVYKYKVSEIFNPNVASDLKVLLNPRGPIVLTVCRISPEKGLNYLIEASRTITEKLPNVRIIIKGYLGADASSAEKKHYAELVELIRKYDLQKHVKILEGSSHSEIAKYMAAADVFVLPSISEGLGLVILEALAIGVPIVASRVGGIPDILINEYNGLLVEPRNVESLAKAVLRILFDARLRSRIMEGGLKTIGCTKENEIEGLLSKFMFEVRVK